MTLDTEDTMIRPTGQITMTEAEKTTIILRCILPGTQSKPPFYVLHVSDIFAIK